MLLNIAGIFIYNLLNTILMCISFVALTRILKHFNITISKYWIIIFASAWLTAQFYILPTLPMAIN